MRRVGDQADEREVLPEIVGHLSHDERVDHHGARGAEDERVAVGRGARGRRRADAAARAVAVERHHRLSDDGGEVLGVQPADDVGRPAGGERHDHLDRLGRILLRRESRAGCEQQREKERVLHVRLPKSWTQSAYVARRAMSPPSCRL